MKDEMNDIIQKNMVSMISDIDINHVDYDIRMSMIDSMVKLIVDTVGDKSPSKEVVKFLDPTKEFDIMNIEADIKTSKPENVILKEVLCLMEQLDPAQRTVVMHYLKTMFVYDASLLKDRNSFTRQYKPIVRGLKSLKGTPRLYAVNADGSLTSKKKSKSCLILTVQEDSRIVMKR